MTFDEWLKVGVSQGFCTASYCSNHDGWAPEDDDLVETLWDEYEGDHCMFAVRLKSADEREVVSHE